MDNMNEHPSIKRYNERKSSEATHAVSKLSAAELREMCLELGADDVGFVEMTNPTLADQKDAILNLYPWTKAFISIAGRVNRENLRSPARSVASLELHQVEDRLNHATHLLAAALDKKGIRAVSPAAGFPMEADL